MNSLNNSVNSCVCAKGELNNNMPSRVNSLCQDIFEIDMQSEQRDLPRVNIKMRNLNHEDYQQLDEHQIQEIWKIFKKIFQSTRYNNIEKLSYLVQERKKHPESSFIEVFNQLDTAKIPMEKWTNCLGFSESIQSELKKIGIKSYIIGFKSTHSYLEIGHTGLVIPFINQENQEDFILIDINESTLKFKKDIKKTDDPRYPFALVTKTSAWLKEDIFNPYIEFLNPHESMNKDVMRVRNKHSLIQTLLNGKKISLHIAMKNEMIHCFNAQENYKREISFENFLRLKEMDESYYREFSVFMEDLWEDPEEMYEKICEIIRYSDEFKKTILIP